MPLSGTLLHQPLRRACLVAEYPDKGNPGVELFIRPSYLDGNTAVPCSLHCATLLGQINLSVWLGEKPL
jgi:hypothetical protein